MANREEMIAWLKEHQPSISKTQDVDNLPDDTYLSGRMTVHKLYIECHGGTTDWNSLQPKVVNKFFSEPPDNGDPTAIDPLSMDSGWIHFDAPRGIRMGISSGGVLSVKGHPFTKARKLMCDEEQINTGLSEHYEQGKTL